MANDLNRVTMICRLTQDPQLRYTNGGAPVVNFSVANNENYKNSSGEKVEEVSFFNCIAWSKLGEIIAQYAKKGNQIAIEGRLKQKTWEDQNGGKRSAVEIVVENFQFLGSKNDNSSGSVGNQNEPEQNSFDENTDIPF